MLGCQRWQRLCWQGTPGTFHNEQGASRCTVYVGCAGVAATSAVDTGPRSHGHAFEAQVRDVPLCFVRVVEGRSLTWADPPRLNCRNRVLTGQTHEPTGH